MNRQLCSEWRNIETAPKDGTEIDLWAMGRRVSNCRWAKPTHANWGDRHGCDQDLPEQWVTRSNCAWDRRNGEPTHWMPVPAPAVPAHSVSETSP